jgi:hypothetical protein
MAQEQRAVYSSELLFEPRLIPKLVGQMIKQDAHTDSGDRGWIINTASIMGQVGVANACE